MTVNELIEILSKVKNKEIDIVMDDGVSNVFQITGVLGYKNSDGSIPCKIDSLDIKYVEILQ